MVLKEYRIPVPVTLEEYKRAQLYMVAKFSREQTHGGEGVQILENNPFSKDGQQGQYTRKLIRIGSRLPLWLKSLLPVSMLQIEETAWNCYPFSKTVYACPFLGDKLSITIETKYEPDAGFIENALGIDSTLQSQRVVEIVDITEPLNDSTKYKVEEDPVNFVSKKTGRGKLIPGWYKTATQPVMCSYKLVSVEFKAWFIASKVENFIHGFIKQILLLGHRQAFCWIDEWYDLTLDDIRKIETQTKDILDLEASSSMEEDQS
eukprot:TRINITY_DN8512_c0_g1_i1.p1 TRINITY_DN8512_c0_g1~~TRINITY_DN8512_c0_g1_i1.p1  ORF type:complete len:281 (-),score=55.74 TRINITY_DN8512_c0_g1_i1:52-837(-)